MQGRVLRSRRKALSTPSASVSFQSDHRQETHEFWCARSISSICVGKEGLGNVTISYNRQKGFTSIRSCGMGMELERKLTSNDWAYHSLTFSILGILLNPSGSPSSSTTRCDRRIGSSSDRNSEALSRVPWDGCWPKRIICCSETNESELDCSTGKVREGEGSYLLFEESWRNDLSCPIVRC